MLRRIVLAILPILAVLISAPEVRCGEVRVNVGESGFEPRHVTVNVGDFVVWGWTGWCISGIASGDTTTRVMDYRFGTPNSSMSPDSSYSWRADAPGTVSYFAWTGCRLGAPDAGTITIVPAGAAVADFRITKVQFDSGPGTTRLQIANLGAADGDLGYHRLATTGSRLEELPNPWDTGTGARGHIPVPSGACVTVHVGNGTNTSTNLYFSWRFGGGDLGSPSDVALFAPMSNEGGISWALPMIDFVEWGVGGQEYESDAVLAGLWAPGSRVQAQGGPQRAIEFCGGSSQHGAGYWSEVASTDFEAIGHCVTPAKRKTWGQLKALYR